ncbi:MAG: hypothetical protein ACK40L_12145 [Hydrogenophaga sp.]
MSDGRLVFTRPDDGTGRLIFGDEGGSETPATEIAVDADFGDDMAASVQLLWDANVSRVLTAFTRQHWQDATPATARAASHWQESRPIAARTAAHWQDATTPTARTSTRWQDSRLLSSRSAAHWQDAAHLRHQVDARWQDELRLRSLASTHWQDAPELRHLIRTRWQEQLRLRALNRTRWQDATPLNYRQAHRSGAAKPVHHGISTRWQDARHPLAGESRFVPPPPPQPDPCYDPETLGQLEFLEPWDGTGRLVFLCVQGPVFPSAPLFILPARYIVTTRSLSAYRLPDLTPLPLYEASVAADWGSFDWKLTATGPKSLFSLLETTSGQPAQMVVEMDGLEWVMAVDDPSDSEGFGNRGASITGRSVTSLLGNPRAREIARSATEDRTAQQLALEALAGTDAGLDWGIEDWVVLAGAWSHYGTPLAAVQAIAEAAGGYLQSHRTLPNLLVRHPYPTLPGGMIGGPWNWGGAFAADVELAPDAVVVANRRRVNGPDVNAVYVSGVSMGGRGHVVRAGSAGDKSAGIVVDPLNTAIQAAQQRGLAILGAGGAKRMWNLDLPILTGPSQPGVIDVGAFVQVNYPTPLRGRVRAVRASSAWGGNPTQTITLEQHLGDL